GLRLDVAGTRGVAAARFADREVAGVRPLERAAGSRDVAVGDDDEVVRLEHRLEEGPEVLFLDLLPSEELELRVLGVGSGVVQHQSGADLAELDEVVE